MGRKQEFTLGHYNSESVLIGGGIPIAPQKASRQMERDQTSRKASDARTLDLQSKRVKAESDAEYKKRRGGRPSFL